MGLNGSSAQSHSDYLYLLLYVLLLIDTQKSLKLYQVPL